MIRYLRWTSNRTNCYWFLKLDDATNRIIGELRPFFLKDSLSGDPTTYEYELVEKIPYCQNQLGHYERICSDE